MNKKGMTLIELLVYMVLAAFLLAPVIMLMQNSSVSMARDAVNMELKISGRDVVNIMYDDLKNTGFKLRPNTFKSDSMATCLVFSPPDPVTGVTAVITNDSSSITSVNGAGYYDELKAIMGKLNDAGTWVGVDTISYGVETTSATKELKRGRGNNGSHGMHAIARNVAALKFRYSEDLVDWYDEIESDLSYKKAIKYIKVVLVVKDNKKLSPVTKQDFVLTDEITLHVDDKALYERYEIVIPVPNNGLFIEDAI